MKKRKEKMLIQKEKKINVPSSLAPTENRSTTQRKSLNVRNDLIPCSTINWIRNAVSILYN